MFFVPGGGMNDQAWGLVEDQQRGVLEENIQRYGFRLRFGGPGFRPIHLDLFAGAGGMGRFDGMPVDSDVSFVNQPLDGPAGSRRELAPQVSIEPLLGQRFFDGEEFGAG